MYKDLNAKAFEEGIKNDPNAVVLDVRTAAEGADGVIPNTVVIDLMRGDFAEQVKKLDPNKSYYVYCRSGSRSAAACGAMSHWGFSKLHNLAGGIMCWTGEVAYPQSMHE